MKLSFGQLWAVLFLFRAFTFISSAADYSVQRILGTAVSVLIQLFIAVPVIRFCRKNISDTEKFRKGGILFALYFIYTGMTAFGKILDITAAENFAVSGKIFPVVLTAAAVLYCSRLGLGSAGRAAVVVSGIFILFTAILVLTSSGDIKAENISGSYDESPVYHYILTDFSESTELPAVIILSLFTDRNREKGVYIYFASKFLLVSVVTLLGAAVLGRVSALADYPFFELCSFSSPLGVQRSDALFISAYALTAVIFITVGIVMSAFWMKKYFSHAEIVSMIFMAAGGLVLRGEAVYTADFIFTAAFTSAVVIYLILKGKRNDRKGCCT